MMFNPNPVPCIWAAFELLKNLLYRFCCSFSGIPMPWSFTLIINVCSFCSITRSMLESSGEYLMALDKRLVRI